MKTDEPAGGPPLQSEPEPAPETAPPQAPPAETEQDGRKEPEQVVLKHPMAEMDDGMRRIVLTIAPDGRSVNAELNETASDLEFLKVLEMVTQDLLRGPQTGAMPAPPSG